MYQLKGNVPSN